jgi:hypothetical protein
MLIVLAALLLVTFLINISKQGRLPSLVNLSGTTYVLTNEPYEETTHFDENYFVRKKVERYSYPENNLESNFLEVGTEIYLPKEAAESIIVYKKNGSLYVARENLDSR